MAVTTAPATSHSTMSSALPRGISVPLRRRPSFVRRLDLARSHGGSNTYFCAGARDGAMARVEVLASSERRRRWSVEQKQATGRSGVVREWHVRLTG